MLIRHSTRARMPIFSPLSSCFMSALGQRQRPVRPGLTALQLPGEAGSEPALRHPVGRRGPDGPGETFHVDGARLADWPVNQAANASALTPSALVPSPNSATTGRAPARTCGGY